MSVGERDQHHEPGGPLDQGRDWTHAFAEDKVAFPVPRYGAVVGLGGSLGLFDDAIKSVNLSGSVPKGTEPEIRSGGSVLVQDMGDTCLKT
jgi:hypothetical protein